jgi:ABC-type nitrate/sulfonate/bicarbonate transport system substrate-binding protein
MTTTNVASKDAHPKGAAVKAEATYTICPVFTGSNVAAELGWLDEEFEKAGVKLTYLRSLPDDIGWLPHYSHRLENLFRDGGANPALWAKADVQDTKLVGLTAAPFGGHVVVRAKSGLHRVEDLAGRRIGLPRSLNAEKVDWWRASAHRALVEALALHGLTAKDVQFEDVADPDVHVSGQFKRPSQVWEARKLSFGNPEVRALAEGRVDAIFSSHGRTETLEETGEFKVIEDLGRHPDWTLRVSNSPWTISVNTRLAEEHPEAVVAFLRAAIRGGRWTKANPEEAAEVLTRVTFFRSARQVRRLLAATDADLVPSLSPRNLAGLELQKDFLLEHGYIKHDLDVRKWADPTFLEKALASL